MTVEDITNRLNQYFSWLSSRQLEEWWPLLIAIAALVIVLIVLVLRSRRKVLPGNALLRDIIGIKLADHNKTGHRTDRTEKGHSANVPAKRGRRKRRINTKKGFKIAIKELKQRRGEIIKSRQAELRLRQVSAAMATVNEQIQNEVEVTESRQVEELPEQRVAEIAAVIEQFQLEITDSSQTEQRPKQQVAEFVSFNEPFQPEVTYSRQDKQHPIEKVYEIVPVNEPFQLEVTDSIQAEELPEQKVYEIVPVNELLQLEKSEQGQSEKVPEESSEQDLKSKRQSQPFDIAEFSKAAISRRQRLRSGIYNEYSDLDEA